MKHSKSEWTLNTLKEYFERRFTDLSIAVNRAEVFAKEKFENTNEWRKSYDDLTRGYMTRTEQVGTDKSQDERIDRVERDVQKIENMKQGGSIVWAYVLSAISLLAAIVSIALSF